MVLLRPKTVVVRDAGLQAMSAVSMDSGFDEAHERIVLSYDEAFENDH